jgi:RNA polymerase sigma factor (sigma-70 family)
MVNFDEKSIVAGCLKGDLRSQKQLYEHFKLKMFMVCLRYASDKTEAEDMLQDGFIQVFKEMHQYDDTRGSLDAWVRRVMINASLQVIRKKKLAFVEIAESHYNVSSDDDIVSDLSMKELLLFIQKLPTGYRTVFNMYVIDGMQHNEIADELRISINTSKTQLFKAKQMLRKMITEALVVTG